MKASELRKKTDKELTEELVALLREQFNLRMQRGSGQAPRSNLFGRARKGIARVLTVMNEKRLEGKSA